MTDFFKYKMAFIVIFIAVFSACSYDNAEEFYGEANDCFAEEVTFTEHVAPILEKKCFACHGEQSFATAGAGINLETFESLKSYAENGALLGAVQHDPNYEAMPIGGNKLAECSIEAIRLWIEAGALQN